MELTEAVEMAAERLDEAKTELAEQESFAEATERAHLEAVRAIADQREGIARLEGQVANLRTRTDPSTRRPRGSPRRSRRPPNAPTTPVTHRTQPRHC